MAIEKDRLVGEIENKLNLVITMSIFFPGFILWISNTPQSSITDPTQNAIAWSMMLGVYLISYFIFQLRKGGNIRKERANILNTAVLFGIFSYVIPIFVSIYSLSRPSLSLLSFKIFS
ncbi:MAG: hypothetical protein PHG66_06695, partial [Candidatus Colwellbacteria bacterium]|nr:hypothetical protein [Candidatus Colwellbacteria bacterium]